MRKILKNKINNKGITLIALVITIIVLLILAGVSIATLTGDNRTFN
jgi:type II secretory pathway pseudopilin PulG